MNQNTTAQVTTALTIVDLAPALGAVLPDNIGAALELYQVVTDLQPPAVDLAAETLDVKTVAKLVDRLAAAGAAEKPYLQARDTIREEAARRLIRTVAAAGDTILGGLADSFTDLAASFTTAFRKLPRNWADPAALVAGGTDAVQAFVAAQELLPFLDAYRKVRTGLGDLGHGAAVGARQVATLFCTVPDTMVADAVTAARSGTLGLWGAWLAIDGVELVWHPSAATHKAAAAAVPSARLVAVPGPDGVGHRQVKQVTPA